MLIQRHGSRLPATSTPCPAARPSRTTSLSERPHCAATSPGIPAGTLLHGNLHYGEVRAAEREPWPAIAPQPLNGDPSYFLVPMLWNGCDRRDLPRVA